jgi:hypothetical protein
MANLFFDLAILSQRPSLGSWPTAATQKRAFGPMAMSLMYPKRGILEIASTPRSDAFSPVDT